MKRSQLAVNTVSTKGEFAASLAAYRDAGFTNVEFHLPQVKAYLAEGHDVGDVRRLLKQCRLRCIGGFEGSVACFAPAGELEANHAGIVENAELVAALGGDVLVVGTDGPGSQGTESDPVHAIVQTFARLAAQIAASGVSLCLEFNWSPVIKSLRAAVEVARATGAENVGVLFDPAHYHCTPTKFAEIGPQSVPYIKHVHVDDVQDKPGERSDCNADRVLPGEGCLDLKRLFGALERWGYGGFFSIELFDPALWAMPVEAAARRLYGSMVPLCDDADRL